MTKKKSTETLLDKIGGKGKYQLIITSILFFMNLAGNFVVEISPLMSSKPKVEFTDEYGKYHNTTLTYDICRDYNWSITKSDNNWAFKYVYFCDKLKTSIMDCSFLVGNVIGLLILKFLTEYSKESLLKVIQLINSLTFLLSLFDTYETTIFMNLMFGSTYFSTYVIKNSILTDLADKSIRSKLFSFLFFSKVLLSLFTPTLYSTINSIEWKYLYLIVFGFNVLISIIIIYYVHDNPRNNINKNEQEEAIKNSIFIAEQNGKIKETPEATSLNDINETLNIKIDDKMTREELRDWIINHYFKEDDKEDSKITIIEDVSPSTKVKNRLISHIIIGVLMSFLSLSLYLTYYEKKKFTKQENFNLIYTISVCVGGILFIPFNFIVDSRIGRKGTMLILCILAICPRFISNLIFSETHMIAFFMMFAVTFVTPVFFHIFFAESFTNQERITVYSLLSLCSRVAVIGVPYLVEYLSDLVFSIVFCTLIVGQVVCVLLSKETRGQDLKD